MSGKSSTDARRVLLGAGLAAAQATPAPATPATPATSPAPASSVDRGAVPIHQFVITPRAGYLTFDRAAGLKAGGTLGVDVQYMFTRSFSVGTDFSFARANTRGEDFPAALTYGLASTGDTTFIFNVTQPVSVVDALIAAVYRAPSFGRVSPYVTGGGGIYALYLDPEANNGPKRYVKPSMMAGAGLEFRISRIAGIQLDARDKIFTKYDRDRLRPTDVKRFGNPLYLEGHSLPPKPKSTLNNFMFSIGFTFSPSGTDDQTGPRVPEDQR